MISVRHLSHRYGALRALDDVSLDVAAGKVVGLVGPNGAGKTTLMRAISTLLAPTSGTVIVAGHDVAREPAQVRRLVGYLPERASLYPELAAWEYLDLFAEMAGHPREMRTRRVGDAIERIGLADRRETPTRELSKGLKQRLAMQATLMHDPRVLVLDEPTDGLDPVSRLDVLAQVKAFGHEGRAVLLSSHVLAEVETTADEALVLTSGRLVEDTLPAAAHRYWIRIRGDAEAARTLIAARDDVASAVVVNVSKGILAVELGRGIVDASALITGLASAGIAIVEVSEERSTLQDRFARAVQRP